VALDRCDVMLTILTGQGGVGLIKDVNVSRYAIALSGSRFLPTLIHVNLK
jgi:hypothetical protein